MRLSTVFQRRCVFTTLIIIYGFFPSKGWSQNRTSQREVSLYTFKYLGLPVAQGYINISDTLIEDGRWVKHIEACASSVSPTSFLFNIDNRYVTTIDAKTGYPLAYEKIIEQSNFSEKILIHFDQKQGYIHSGNDHLATLTHETHNFFSALYFLLNHSFQPHEVLHLPVFAAGEIWEAEIQALRVEKVVTEVGAHPAVFIEIEFQRSSPTHNTIMNTDVLTHRLISEGKKTRVWISIGQERTMVKGIYSLFPAELQMILTEYHNRKY